VVGLRLLCCTARSGGNVLPPIQLPSHLTQHQRNPARHQQEADATVRAAEAERRANEARLAELQRQLESKKQEESRWGGGATTAALLLAVFRAGMQICALRGPCVNPQPAN